MLALKVALALAALVGFVGVFLRVVEWNRQKAPRGRTDSPPPFGVNCRCDLDPLPDATFTAEDVKRDLGLWIDRYGKLGYELKPYQRAAIDGILSDRDVSLGRFGYGAKVMDPPFPVFHLSTTEERAIWDAPRLVIDHWKRSLWGFGKRWTRITPKGLVRYQAGGYISAQTLKDTLLRRSE